MFGGNPPLQLSRTLHSTLRFLAQHELYLLIFPLVPVLAIVLLEWLRHNRRSWGYYTLAYLMVFAFNLAYMFVVVMMMFTRHPEPRFYSR